MRSACPHRWQWPSPCASSPCGSERDEWADDEALPRKLAGFRGELPELMRADVPPPLTPGAHVALKEDGLLRSRDTESRDRRVSSDEAKHGEVIIDHRLGISRLPFCSTPT
jgi:hypothetical protein